jgi:hypothetical protein
MLEELDFQNKTQMRRIFLFGLIFIGLLLGGCNSKPKAYRVGILSGSDTFSTCGQLGLNYSNGRRLYL